MLTRNSHIQWTRRTSVILCAAAIPLAHIPSLQADDLSATLSLTSDYVFRGVSLTDGPALQASVDYIFDSGFYIGTWTSNYDFDTATDRELDFYLGYSHPLSNDMTLSASASRYTYFDEHEIDYNEYHVGLSRGPLDAKAWYAIDYGGTDGDAQYYEIGFNSALPMDISLELRAGHSIFDTQTGINDYTDFVIAAKKTFGRFNSEVRLTDTDENQFGGREDLRIFITVSTTFPYKK